MSVRNFIVAEIENSSFEGDSGLRNFTKILNHLGYKDEPFDHCSALESFVKDNPGAYEKLIDFIEMHFDDQFTDYSDNKYDDDWIYEDEEETNRRDEKNGLYGEYLDDCN